MSEKSSAEHNLSHSQPMNWNQRSPEILLPLPNEVLDELHGIQTQIFPVTISEEVKKPPEEALPLPSPAAEPSITPSPATVITNTLLKANGKSVIVFVASLLAIIVATIAVSAYNNIIVKPQIAGLNQQISLLLEKTDKDKEFLDKHEKAIKRLADALNHNAVATNSLATTVKDNADVANSNAEIANSNARAIASSRDSLTETVNDNADTANENTATENENNSSSSDY